MTKHANPVIGVDIGGTKIAAALLQFHDDDYTLSSVVSAPTPVNQGADAILNVVIDLCQQIITDAAHKPFAVGIGTAGQVNVETGAIIHAVDTIPGWTGAPVGETVAHALALPVTVDNDVNTMALGEAKFGVGKQYGDVVYLTVGTGVGGALILGGQLRHGANGIAGEIGHTLVDWERKRLCTCGSYGHLEAYASGPAMAQRYQELVAGAASSDLKTVGRAARAGDANALAVIVEGARILGMAVAGYLHLIDPDAVIVGGGVPELGDMWWQPMIDAIQHDRFPTVSATPILRASMGNRAGIVGAGWAAYTASRND